MLAKGDPMAKRKRLSPAPFAAPDAAPEGPGGPLETKAALGWVGHGTRRAPIAEVAGESAAQSAFEEVRAELAAARAEGRMVLALPLAAVEARHLIRDRVAMDEGELATLKASLAARGQQTPVEVLELAPGRYGLISGWRRLTALAALLEETGDAARFGQVKALLRAPAEVSETYLAMVEENEIRADLSFYERARIAVEAARAGVFPDAQTAVQRLFAAARAPKRSKILSFAVLVEQLDDALRFPAAIPEKVGLALVGALQGDIRFRHRLVEALRAADPADAAAERRVLDAALKGDRPTPARGGDGEEIAPGLRLEAGRGRVTLAGPAVDAALLDDLRRWLATR
jgi:hypothetical protein